MGVPGLAGLPINETAAPHRLGAALTYARRYALFTLDAPNLPSAGLSPDVQKDAARSEKGPGELDQPAIEPKPGRPAQASERRLRTEKAKSPSLPPDASENLRHQLIGELAQLRNPVALAIWAHRALPLKNQLATIDAQTVEAAFAARLSQIEDQKANSLDHKPLQTDPGDHRN